MVNDGRRKLGENEFLIKDSSYNFDDSLIRKFAQSKGYTYESLDSAKINEITNSEEFRKFTIFKS